MKTHFIRKFTNALSTHPQTIDRAYLFRFYTPSKRMSARGFSTSARKLLELVGRVTLQDVMQVNEKSGPQWAENVQSVANTIDSQRTDVASYEIQGAKAHKSSKDPNETQDVITLGFYSARGTRIGSAHAREDGTYTFQASRAGR